MSTLTQIIMMTALWCGDPGGNQTNPAIVFECRKEKVQCFSRLRTPKGKDPIEQFVSECLK